ncbi:hypothetical protein T12_16136 [Trichinella patagoniensis]|uniref:Uncharacterized protein n=1 Tax=Trichinella patagoniensis TaxID=990121 RepID=A0A0V1AGB4_9BILA|nr:hypothetical protein T12_16136 [Trichinella patagoniensis]
MITQKVINAVGNSSTVIIITGGQPSLFAALHCKPHRTKTPNKDRNSSFASVVSKKLNNNNNNHNFDVFLANIQEEDVDMFSGSIRFQQLTRCRYPEFPTNVSYKMDIYLTMKSGNAILQLDVAKVWAELREAINATDADNSPEEEDSLFSATDDAEMEMYRKQFQIEPLKEFQSKFTSEKFVEIMLIIKDKCTSLCKVLHHGALCESHISKDGSVLLPTEVYTLAKSLIDILEKDKTKEICENFQQSVQDFISIGEQREREVTEFVHYSNQLIATRVSFHSSHLFRILFALRTMTSCHVNYRPLPLEGSRPPPLQINETNIWYNIALNLTMGTLFPLTSVANNVSELLLRIVFGNKEGNSTDWSDENAPPSPLFENGIVNLLFYDLLIPVAYGLGWFVAVLLLTLIYCACASRKKADALKKSPIIALNAILLLLVMAMSAAMITLAFFAITGSPAMYRGLSNLQENVFPLGDLMLNYSLKTNKQLYQLAAQETDQALQIFDWCYRRKRSVTLPEETEFYDNCKVAMKYIEAHIEGFKTECMPFSSSNCDEYFSRKIASSGNIMKTTKHDENIEASSSAADQNMRYKRSFSKINFKNLLTAFAAAIDKIGHQTVKFGDSLRDRIQYFLKILSPYLIFARYISILVLYWLLGISLLYCLGAILMTKRIFQKGVASTAKFKIFRSGSSCAAATSFLIACYLCFWIAVGGYVYISCENAKNVEDRSGLNVITHDDIEQIDLFRLANEAIHLLKRAKDEPLNGEDFHLFKSRFRRYAGNSKSVSRTEYAIQQNVFRSCKAGKTLYSALGIQESTGIRYVRSRRQSNGSSHGNSVEKNHTLDALEKLILQSSVENESCTSLKSRIIGFVKLLHNFMLKVESRKVLVKRQTRSSMNMLYNHLQNEVLECDSLLYQLQTFHKAICVDIALPFNMYWIVVVMWTILAYFAAYLALIIEYSYGENYGKPIDDIESSKVSNKGESTAEGKSEAYICLLHSSQFSQEKSAVDKATSQSEIKDAAQSSVSKAVDQSKKDMSRYDKGERSFGDFSAISRHTAHARKRLSSYASEAAGRMRDRYDRVRRRRHRSDKYDESVGEPPRRRWRDRIDFRRRRRMDVSEMTRTYDDGPSRGSRDRCDESEMTRARESEDSRRP